MLGAFACAAVSACAQAPDVFVRADLRANFGGLNGRSPTLRGYDSLGTYGTVGLILHLEPGLRAYVAQRLDRIPDDPDDNPLDEAFVEDPGYWKAGKQYMPFGQSNLIRESVYGGRLDTHLGGEAVPASIAVCDAGRGLQAGVIGRVGNKIGVSFAVGRHFAISGSSLALIRRPEGSPGAGAGYRQAFGLDYASKRGAMGASVEIVLLQEGHTAADPKRIVSDASVVLGVAANGTLRIGWSRDWNADASYYRIHGRHYLGDSVWIEPFLRYRGGTLFDSGLCINIRT